MTRYGDDRSVVRSPAEKSQVEKPAQTAPGVKGVSNGLEIKAGQ
jgi:hypothetical protein